MSLINRVALCLAALAFAVQAAPAWAQYGPRPGGDNPAGEGQENPIPRPAGAAITVPEYIKPGYQMLYMSASSSESDDANKPGSAGMGYTEYTIVAVLKDKVLVNTAFYLAPNGVPLTAQGALDPTTDPRVQLSGASSMAIGEFALKSGGAMWMTADELKQLQSGNGVEINRGPWPYNGRQVNAVTVTVKGNDHISSSTYNADTGEKLTDRNASGPMRRGDTGVNPFNRKHQSQSQLISTRQVDSPLIGAAWPAWAKTVKTMSYAGTYSMAVPGVQTPPVQMSLALKFTDRGDGYVIGKSTSQVQGSPPSESPIMQGPGTALGYWVHPDVLSKLDQGQIDQNKTLRTTLTYQVQDGNLGRLGVFVLTNDAQTFYAVSAYNLRNGALTYMSHHLADTGTTIEYTLTGME
ncbi:MAG: hypothetical protein ACE37H_09130 [Phycisphaeraceae bacterium]